MSDKTITILFVLGLLHAWGAGALYDAGLPGCCTSAYIIAGILMLSAFVGKASKSNAL